VGLILDSSVIIAAERLGRSVYEMLDSLLDQSDDPEFAISVVTVLEQSHGIARADSVQRRSVRTKFLDDLLAGLPVHPVSIAIALRAGRLDGELASRGTRVALGDLLIGAAALELGYAVATNNLRHFNQIPGLAISHV
jgi:predicted nucleic acid-binding protein